MTDGVKNSAELRAHRVHELVNVSVNEDALGSIIAFPFEEGIFRVIIPQKNEIIDHLIPKDSVGHVVKSGPPGDPVYHLLNRLSFEFEFVYEGDVTNLAMSLHFQLALADQGWWPEFRQLNHRLSEMINLWWNIFHTHTGLSQLGVEDIVRARLEEQALLLYRVSDGAVIQRFNGAFTFSDYLELKSDDVAVVSEIMARGFTTSVWEDYAAKAKRSYLKGEIINAILETSIACESVGSTCADLALAKKMPQSIATYVASMRFSNLLDRLSDILPLSAECLASIPSVKGLMKLRNEIVHKAHVDIAAEEVLPLLRESWIFVRALENDFSKLESSVAV